MRTRLYKWESRGVEGYTIQPWEKESTGTDVILKIKESTEDENYDEFLEEQVTEIIKKLLRFYPLSDKNGCTRSRLKEGSDSEHEEYTAEEIVNSMVPIWKKNKNELTPQDYENFYTESVTALISL